MTQVDTKAPPPDAVFAMSLALYEPELTGNLDNTYCENLIKALAKHGYTLRRETMTEAELEREANRISFNEVGGNKKVFLEDAIDLAKKYAGRV